MFNDWIYIHYTDISLDIFSNSNMIHCFSSPIPIEFYIFLKLNFFYVARMGPQMNKKKKFGVRGERDKDKT